MKGYQTANNNINMTNVEVNDGNHIILSMKSQVKPASVQGCVFRR